MEEGKLYTFEEAHVLDEKDRVKGLRVKGKQMPFGGSWKYDKEADELVLDEEPTKAPENKPAEERKD
jgi:hypothetical protein